MSVSSSVVACAVHDSRRQLPRVSDQMMSAKSVKKVEIREIRNDKIRRELNCELQVL